MKLERLKLPELLKVPLRANGDAPRVSIAAGVAWLETPALFPKTGRVLSSSSNGREFQPVVAPFATLRTMVGTERGLVIVESGALMRSRDGRTWSPLPAPEGLQPQLAAASSGPLFALAPFGGALQSLAGPAHTWKVLAPSAPAEVLLCAAPEAVFVSGVAGLFRFSGAGFVKASGLPKKCVVTSVVRLPSGTCLALASKLYRSSDDGVTFEEVPLRATELRALAAVGEAVVLIDREAVMKSTDGGKTFVEISRAADAGFSQIASWGSGAFVLDAKRWALFRLAESADAFAVRPAPFIPGLDGLSVLGQAIDLGRMVAPSLKSLSLIGPQVAASSFAEAEVPRLERLSLSSAGAVFAVPKLKAPSLVALALLGSANTESLIEELAISPWCAQLRELDLSSGALTSHEVLLEHAPRLAHLDKLRLDGNQLSPEAAGLISAALPRASVSAQTAAFDPETLAIELAVG